MCARKLKYSSGDELPLYATPEEAMREGNRREEEERRRRQMEYQKPKYGQQVGVGMHHAAPTEAQGMRMNSNPQIPVGNNNGMGYAQPVGYQSNVAQYGNRIPSAEQYGYASQQTQGQGPHTLAPHSQGKPQVQTRGQLKPPMMNKYGGAQSLTSQTTPQPIMRQQLYASQPRPHSQPQAQQNASGYGAPPQSRFGPAQGVQQVQQHPSHNSPSNIQYSQAAVQQYTHGGSHGGSQFSQGPHQHFHIQSQSQQQQQLLSQPQPQLQQPKLATQPQPQHHRNGIPPANGQGRPYGQPVVGSGTLAPVQPVHQNAQTLAPAPIQQSSQQSTQQRVPQTLAPPSGAQSTPPAAGQKPPSAPPSEQQRGDSRSFVNPVPTANNVSNTSYAVVGNNTTGEDHDAAVARKLFQNHDIRKLERLTADELQNLLQNDDNTQFCMSSVQALISLFGVSRFGTVNLAEFTSLYKRVKKWRMVYVDNDINGSFTISSSEYHNSLQELGYLVPFEVSEKLFDQYAEYMNNNKHTKELKFDKFVESLVWLMRLTKVFRNHDTHQDGIATIYFRDFIETSLYLGKFLPR